MIPEIISSPPLLLAGFSYFGDPFQEANGWSSENAIGRLWQRFMRISQENAAHFEKYKFDQFGYELHIESLETPESGEYEIFVGFAVSSLFADLPTLVFKQLPSVEYAIFTLEGAMIRGNWSEMIFETWLKKSKYESAAGYLIERYDERFKGVDHIEESVMEVLVPIKKKHKR